MNGLNADDKLRAQATQHSVMWSNVLEAAQAHRRAGSIKAAPAPFANAHVSQPAAVVTQLSGPSAHNAPSLPDPEGLLAEPQRVHRCVKRLSLTQGSTMFAVLQTLTQSRQSDMQLANLFKRVRTQMLMLARERELTGKTQEICGNKWSAATQFIGALAGIGLSGLAAFKWRFQDQAVSQFASGVVNIFDQTLGGRAAANEASVVQKAEANTAQQEQMRSDAASAWYEQVKDARKNAQQAIMAHVQMVGDAVSSVWR